MSVREIIKASLQLNYNLHPAYLSYSASPFESIEVHPSTDSGRTESGTGPSQQASPMISACATNPTRLSEFQCRTSIELLFS